MMNLVILGGNSKSNEPWVMQVQSLLGPIFDETYVHKYLHWQGKTSSMNKDKEIEILSNIIPRNKEYIIFAKSAGTIVASKGIKDQKLAPKGCIFLGFPLRAYYLRLDEITSYLTNISVPILFIQNARDPVCSGTELQKYLEKIHLNNYQLEILDASGHSYQDLSRLKLLVSNFIAISK